MINILFFNKGGKQIIIKKVKLLIMIFFIMFLILPIFNCVTKDLIAPEINYIQDNNYISPNDDGVQDVLNIQIRMRDDGFIKYWKLEFFNDKNKLLKTFSSGGTLEEQKDRVFFKKGNVNIPSKITWDGKDNQGKIVPDGVYNFKFTAMDDKKNVTSDKIKKGIVFVDTEKPEMKANVAEKLFSPNDDGNKDLLHIDVDIIKNKIENRDIKNVQEWYVDILNDNNELVKRFVFKEKGIQKLDWDGKNQNGEKVPDGEYAIKLSSKDEAGNFWEQVVSRIIVDTKSTPVSVLLTDYSFSPNNDNKNDTIKFKFYIPVQNNILEWNFKIINSNGNIIKTFSGKGKPNLFLNWDGKNDKGKIAAEGTYNGVLYVKYLSGNNPVDESEKFTLDITKPEANVSLSSDIFSPDNNGIQDELIIKQNTSKEETLWNGTFYDERGKIVKSFSWNEPPGKFEWDGKDNEGKLCDDGFYYYQLSCTDKAGNNFESIRLKTQIYTKENPLFITARFNSFSPNNDNLFDKQVFEIKISKSIKIDVKEWKLNIYNKINKIIYSAKNSGDIPDTLEWNGKIGKKAAPEGEYYAIFEVIFKAGTKSSSRTKLFLLDTTAPVFNVSTNLKYFSPDDDGENDELVMSLQAKDISGIKSWKILILTPNRKYIFKTFEGVNEPPDKIKWNGNSDTGELVESVEDYPVKLVAIDNVGNTLEREALTISIDILVLKLPDGRLKIRISNIYFQPDLAIMTYNPKNKEILNLLSQSLKKYSHHNVIIEGHVNQFKEELNKKELQVGKDLSTKRAQTVAVELVKRGIKKERLTINGKGFDEPINPWRQGITYEETEKNRRVEFYLYK